MKVIRFFLTLGFTLAHARDRPLFSLQDWSPWGDYAPFFPKVLSAVTIGLPGGAVLGVAMKWPAALSDEQSESPSAQRRDG